MVKEIFEQPGLIRKFIEYYSSEKGREDLVKTALFRPSFVHISGCGTAAHAGYFIREIIEQELRIPAMVELASEFRYRNPILHDDQMALFISQSGETADTLGALELCKKNGLKTMGIINIDGSTIFRG